MNADFVHETVEEEGAPRMIGCFTGWEAVVFELEDEEFVILSREDGEGSQDTNSFASRDPSPSLRSGSG